MTAPSIDESSAPVQTKTCHACGCLFTRPPGLPACKWRTRKQCHVSCRKVTPVETRFRARVDDSAGPDGCWLWLSSRDVRGYGKFSQAAGVIPLAHRFAWELKHGPIPEGLIVRHTCDNPPCVNPAHLEVGTHADNANDMIMRGRSGVSKLTPEVVRRIRSRLAAGERRIVLAREFGVCRATIGRIDRGQSWTEAL